MQRVSVPDPQIREDCRNCFECDWNERPVEIDTARAQVVTDDTEQTLISGLRRGEEWACALLCERYGNTLHGYAAFLLGNDRELAEDVVIRALANAVRGIEHYNPRKASLLTWLYGIVRRQVVSERRKQQRLKSVPKEAQVSLEEAGAADDTADIATRLDAQRAVARLRDLLTGDEMDVLVLHYAEGLSMKEIGQVIGRSEGAVNSLLHRARTKARESLDADEPFDCAQGRHG